MLATSELSHSETGLLFTSHQPTSAWAEPACPQEWSLLLGHGALPYRAAHKAANPSQQQRMRPPPPMLILILWCQIQVLEYLLYVTGPLWARPAYQVPPVYDHSAIFTPLPTNS